MVFEIFTDGSCCIEKGYYASSGSYQICVHGRTVVTGGKFLDGGTGNHGEAYGVLAALREFEKCMDRYDPKGKEAPYTVNLFTDSLITRDACKTNIYRWRKNMRDGVMYTSGGTPVASQEIFQEIYERFLTNKRYKLSFFHLNSHCIDQVFFHRSIARLKECLVKGKCDKELIDKLKDELYHHPRFMQAKESFLLNNRMDISNEQMLRLLVCNLEVDTLAAQILNKGLEERGITRRVKGVTTGGKKKGKKQQEAEEVNAEA